LQNKKIVGRLPPFSLDPPVRGRQHVVVRLRAAVVITLLLQGRAKNEYKRPTTTTMMMMMMMKLPILPRAEKPES